MSSVRRSPRASPQQGPVRSLLQQRQFPAAARRRAEQDWVFFLLEELNGIGDLVRFRQGAKKTEAGDRGDADIGADVDAALGRARAIVETLAWQAGPALAHTWTFAEQRLHFPEDAWGPSVVLARLEPDRPRVEAWRAALSDEARARLAATPSPL